jgi:hypothetical protein
LTLRIIFGLVSVAASGLLVAIEDSVWHPETRTPALVLIGVVGMIAFTESTRAAIVEHRLVRLRKLQEAIHDDLIAALLQLGRLKGLSLETTSIGVYLERRQLRPFFRQYLFALDRLRMFPVPHSAGSSGRNGRG